MDDDIICNSQKTLDKQTVILTLDGLLNSRLIWLAKNQFFLFPKSVRISTTPAPSASESH